MLVSAPTMGLRGPLPRRDTEHRAKVGHRPPASSPAIPESVKADGKVIYARLKALGDYWGALAEADMERNIKRPSPALWAALKCWKEALQVACRIGVLPDEPDEGPKDPHDELAARRRARRPATRRRAGRPRGARRRGGR